MIQKYMSKKTKHNMASDLAWYPTKNSDFPMTDTRVTNVQTH